MEVKIPKLRPFRQEFRGETLALRESLSTSNSIILLVIQMGEILKNYFLSVGLSKQKRI